MPELFLDPKVLNYSGDRYQFILMTLKWARALKAKGMPDPMPVLVERALKEIAENRVTFEEIMANKLASEAPEEVPAVVSVAGEGKAEAAAAEAEETEGAKKTKKKKKKEE
jgi:hypothetical protein